MNTEAVGLIVIFINISKRFVLLFMVFYTDACVFLPILSEEGSPSYKSSCSCKFIIKINKSSLLGPKRGAEQELTKNNKVYR